MPAPKKTALINSIDQLQAIVKLMADYRLDSLEIEGIRITKTQHNIDLTEIKTGTQDTPDPKNSKIEDEELYWSA